MKLKYLLLILFFVLPNISYGAIAFDSASTPLFNNAGTDTSFTVAHTITGDNTALVVSVFLNRTTGGATVTGCTYNGDAMSLVNSNGGDDGPNTVTSYLFLLINPDTSTNNIVCSTSGLLTGPKQIFIGGLSYTGVKQTGQPDSNNSITGIESIQTNINQPTTVVESDSWLVGALMDDGAGLTGGAGTGTTYRSDYNPNSAHWADSGGPVSSGSQSLNYTVSIAGTNRYAGGILSLAPSAGGGATGDPQDILIFN